MIRAPLFPGIAKRVSAGQSQAPAEPLPCEPAAIFRFGCFGFRTKPVVVLFSDTQPEQAFRIAVERIPNAEVNDYYLEEIPELPWEKIGGQEEAIKAIKAINIMNI